jgi:hypothetical protein
MLSKLLLWQCRTLSSLLDFIRLSGQVIQQRWQHVLGDVARVLLNRSEMGSVPEPVEK